MKINEYNFIKGLQTRSNCSHDEALYLKQLFGKYISEGRSRVLDHTCAPCVGEMFGAMSEFVNNKNLIIDEE